MKPWVTFILPYYNQPAMLRRQLANWGCYTDFTRAHARLIVVDDGSPIPAIDAMNAHNFTNAFYDWRAELYRIKVDIPWNRAEARNIGALKADTPWIVQLDLDHLMPPEAAENLVLRQAAFTPDNWYRFRRYRVGAADHTRNKDALDRDVRYGEIKPHIDSYLCTPEMYWNAGGYNEDFSGCLGGGSPFLAFMSRLAAPQMAPDSVYLHVHTTDMTPDASAALDRDTTEYSRRKAALQKSGKLKGHDPFRHPYEQVL